MRWSPFRAGVDLVDVARLERMIVDAGEGFFASAWTDAERAEAGGRPERLATRWAAKEATMKALGVGIGSLAPRDIEVRVDARGAPSLVLSGAALRRAEELHIEHWSVSLSHEGPFAIALVIAGVGGTDD